MKHEYKIWLEPTDYKLLQEKAKNTGFTGKGFLSHYLERLARFEIILVDGGLKSFVNLVDKIRTTSFKQKKGFNALFVLIYFCRDIPRPRFTLTARDR